ncbi:MAG TPA: anthranilate phosphoribosyltransferase [Candidatus Gastranaerophilales bacterium]|nr:anthranilate phosphoribosyltransferase [Candidatus Gastranaerophilales bacterium]
MLTDFLNKITQNQHLTEQEARDLIFNISSGDVKPAQIAAFLASIKTKGETVEEITGFASAMREKALKINTIGLDIIVDSCGTGGDGINSYNISTASAIIAAASGITVAKHSNAGITSKCGSSNVLEALGIPLLKEPQDVEISLKKNSIAFIHAPYFHKSAFHVNSVRKELGIRTIFNFLGPLTNPTCPTGQVIGVSNPDMLYKITEVLNNFGCKRALTVCGVNPLMDEISICGKTLIFELNDGKIRNFEITPEVFGFKTASIQEIEGGNPDFNAKIIEDIFSRKIKGAKLEILLLNSAAVLWAGEKAETLEEGIEIAKQIIESGKAYEKLMSLKL